MNGPKMHIHLVPSSFPCKQDKTKQIAVQTYTIKTKTGLHGITKWCFKRVLVSVLSSHEKNSKTAQYPFNGGHSHTLQGRCFKLAY